MISSTVLSSGSSSYLLTYLSLVVLDTIDLDPIRYGPNRFQTGFAIAALIAVVVILWLGLSYHSSRILDEEEAEHVREIQSGIRDNSRNVLRIPYTDDLADYRDRLRQLFVGDFDRKTPTLRSAAISIRRQFRDRRQAASEVVRDEVPALSRLLSLQAMLYLILGSIVVYPLAEWVNLVGAETDPVDLDGLIASVESGGVTFVDLLASYPFSGEILAFAILIVIEVGSVIFSNVVPVAILLFVGAAFVYLGDRVVADDLEPDFYALSPSSIVRFAGGVALVWLVGVVVAVPTGAVADAVGVGIVRLVGAGLGLLVSLAVALWLVSRSIRRAHGRIRDVYGAARENGRGSVRATAYVFARKLIGAFALMTVFVLPIYLFRAVISGKLVDVFSVVLFQSSAQFRITVALVTIAFVVTLVVQTRPAWSDFAEALGYAADRQGLRIALIGRGFPLFATASGIVLAVGSGFFSPTVSIALGVAFGVGVKIFVELRTRASLAYYHADREPAKPTRVFVEGTSVDDARGDPIFVAWVNGYPLAGRDVDDLVDQILNDARSIFENASPEPSIFRYYFDVLDDGIVDFDRVENIYYGEISKTIDDELDRVDGRMSEDRLDDLMTEQFQPDLYREVKERKREKNRIVIRDGDVSAGLSRPSGQF